MVVEAAQRARVPVMIIINLSPLRIDSETSPWTDYKGKRATRKSLRMGDFFYHLYRKLSRAEYKRILSLMENGMKGGNLGETENGIS